MLTKVPDLIDLYVRSMGKRLRVTAIADNDDEANAHMATTDDAVIACVGPLVLMANMYDKGEKIANV
jgi:hypothetical protein